MGFLHKIGFLTSDPEEEKEKAAEAARKAAEARKKAAADARKKVGQPAKPSPKFMKKTADAITRRQRMLDKAMKE